MDTLKEKMMFDQMYNQGEMLWAVWESSANNLKEHQLLSKPSFYTVPNGSSYVGLNN